MKRKKVFIIRRMSRLHYLIIFLLFFAVDLYADGFIVMPRPHPTVTTPFPLEVKYHHVQVSIMEQVATTAIDQEFYNPTAQTLEGYYMFPVPDGAMLQKFSMFINGKEAEAELLDAEKARNIYEDIVRRMRDPALLEYVGNSMFKVRIYPIEPYATKRVKITYHELLQKDNNLISYMYPLNTEKFSAKPLKNVAIQVKLQSKGELKNIFSTSHDIDLVRKSNKKAVVSFEKNMVKPTTDFRLYYSSTTSGIGMTMQAYREQEHDGFFLMNINPGIPKPDQQEYPKDITFVLDVSGSMAGKTLTQAKKALLYCIENLHKNDRFQIIRFSTEAEALFKGLTAPTGGNLKQAGSFIKSLRPLGGTNIDEALDLALQSPKGHARPHYIIFITDGKPTIGQTDEQKLLQKLKKTPTAHTRIFTFGIGYDINTHLLDKIALRTKAYRSYISPDENIETTISSFYEKVSSPILTNLTFKVTGSDVTIFKRYPDELPDLFKGSSISLLGRYRGSGRATVILNGELNGKKKSYHYTQVFPAVSKHNEAIVPLWASRRIGFLLDAIRLHGENKEIIDEIIDIARTYGIITPYTSYLIVEDESIRVQRRQLDRNAQTLGNIVPRAADVMTQNRQEYASLQKKSGLGSVRSSKEVQALYNARNMEQTQQGESRLYFKNKQGTMVNISKQVKNIKGRAFYNNGSSWIDAYLQSKKWSRKVRIKFASSDYFSLLKKSPKAAPFLSLGKNVRFIMDNVLYEITE